ncbi:methyltransferase domain-containing protein [Pseudokineococcus basanitobsidens]|uniref:Methyltransferase domain-containing protein n=1 Tax=Pseudokineococcus basanitobsidens TaxID=1926649 RepID=A0ABU8RIQ2_9ACTN
MGREEPAEGDAAAARAVWAAGDYEPVAARLQPGADALAAEVRRRLGAGRGRRALDVAAGTGNAAAALARDGWSVLATDLVPEMVERGADRTRAEGLDVAWRRADLAAAPVPDASQQVVVSSFGLVFAQDPGAAAAEARRVLAPGGVLALAAWRRDGLVADLSREVAAALGAPDDGRRDSFVWGEEAGERLLTAAGFADVRVARVPLPWRFGSAAELRRFLGEQSPAHAGAVRRLGPARGRALLERLVARHDRWADRRGAVDADGGALVVSALAV